VRLLFSEISVHPFDPDFRGLTLRKTPEEQRPGVPCRRYFLRFYNLHGVLLRKELLEHIV